MEYYEHKHIVFLFFFLQRYMINSKIRNVYQSNRGLFSFHGDFNKTLSSLETLRDVKNHLAQAFLFLSTA